MRYTYFYKNKFFLEVYVIFLIVLSVCVSGYSQVTTSSLNLKQAIQYAVEHSPEFISLEKEMKSAGLDEQSAQSKMYPSLDLSATHGINDQSPRVGQGPWLSEFNITLTENLYDNGNLLTEYKIAKKRNQQARLTFEDKKNALALKIATEFIEYSLALQNQKIQQVQFDLIKKQYDLVSKDYYQGVKTQKDYLRFKTQLSRSEIDLLSVKNLIVNYENELRRLLGVSLNSSEDLSFIPIDLNLKKIMTAIKPLNLENHHQYQISELQKEIYSLSAELVRKKNSIEIFASAGVGYLSDQYLETGNSFNDRDRVNWNALITIKYNFFDWGVRRKQSESADLRSQVQSHTEDVKNLKLKKELEQLLLNINLYKNQLRLAEELLKMEQTNLSYIEREYRNGKVQYLDFITGLANLSDAKNKYFSSVADLLKLDYTYRYHEGTLYEQIK